MSVGRGFFGLGRFVSLLVVGCFFVAACGESNDGDDDDDDEADDGGGGTFGSGGTGGATATGGAGGTSSLASQCAIYCQRTAACPGTEPCQANCESSAGDAASLGCSTQYRRALDCMATVADPCVASACAAELDDLFDCAADGGTADCAPTGTGPANGDCVAACQRVQVCPDAEPTDCATSCSNAAATAAMYGCTEELNRLNGCYGTCTDICAITTDDCTQELIG